MVEVEAAMIKENAPVMGAHHHGGRGRARAAGGGERGLGGLRMARSKRGSSLMVRLAEWR